MKLKSGVIIGQMQVPILLAIYIIEPILNSFSQELIATSICDGKHSQNSKHYLGYAIDIRIWTLSANGTTQDCANTIQEALGAEYYVHVEPDHIHVQFNGLPQ